LEPDTQPHRLSRPSTIRRLWQGFAVVLVLTVLAELRAAHETHFEVERWFGFNAAYGFLACAALILIAKAIGLLLKRPDTYYDQACEREERSGRD
jgi:hypothetical protein